MGLADLAPGNLPDTLLVATMLERELEQMSWPNQKNWMRLPC